MQRIFGTTAEFAAATKAMAGNQGLYNGFLAAGLFWALWLGVPGAGGQVAGFFLIWVLLAGIYDAATVSRRILIVQAVPAGLGLQPLAVGWSGCGVVMRIRDAPPIACQWHLLYADSIDNAKLTIHLSRTTAA